jgi:hypothetical protein
MGSAPSAAGGDLRLASAPRGWPAQERLLDRVLRHERPANLVLFVIAHDLGDGVRSGDRMAQTVAEGLLGFFQVVDAMAHAVFAVGALLTAAAMAADGRWLPPVLAVGGLVTILFALSLAITVTDPAIVLGSALNLVWIVGSSLWLLGVLRPSTSASR